MQYARQPVTKLVGWLSDSSAGLLICDFIPHREDIHLWWLSLTGQNRSWHIYIYIYIYITTLDAAWPGLHPSLPRWSLPFTLLCLTKRCAGVPCCFHGFPRVSTDLYVFYCLYRFLWFSSFVIALVWILTIFICLHGTELIFIILDRCFWISMDFHRFCRCW